MSHYRKVETSIHGDAKFRSLSPFGKLAFLTLLTHPSLGSAGAMRASPSALAEELAPGDVAMQDQFRDAFHEVIDKGMAHFDPACLVFVLPNFLKYNPPGNPKVLKSFAKTVDYLPECDLKSQVIQRIEECAGNMGEAYLVAFREAFMKGPAKDIGKGSRKDTGKDTANHRSQNTEYGAQNHSVRDRKDKASTHARENIPAFKSKVEAGRWVSDNLGIEPMDPGFDAAVDAAMQGHHPDMVNDGFDAV